MNIDSSPSFIAGSDLEYVAVNISMEEFSINTTLKRDAESGKGVERWEEIVHQW